MLFLAYEEGQGCLEYAAILGLVVVVVVVAAALVGLPIVANSAW